jgi:hypothetical protein
VGGADGGALGDASCARLGRAFSIAAASSSAPSGGLESGLAGANGLAT